ncbi:hypothetical protein BGX33_009233 [Mortierella sp. NVP41]|nr:hypothetical protein BGX33_009233 [Mortierella sp. NVP41]
MFRKITPLLDECVMVMTPIEMSIRTDNIGFGVEVISGPRNGEYLHAYLNPAKDEYRRRIFGIDRKQQQNDASVAVPKLVGAYLFVSGWIDNWTNAAGQITRRILAVTELTLVAVTSL